MKYTGWIHDDLCNTNTKTPPIWTLRWNNWHTAQNRYWRFRVPYWAFRVGCFLRIFKVKS